MFRNRKVKKEKSDYGTLVMFPDGSSGVDYDGKIYRDSDIPVLINFHDRFRYFINLECGREDERDDYQSEIKYLNFLYNAMHRTYLEIEWNRRDAEIPTTDELVRQDNARRERQCEGLRYVSNIRQLFKALHNSTELCSPYEREKSFNSLKKSINDQFRARDEESKYKDYIHKIPSSEWIRMTNIVCGLKAFGGSKGCSKMTNRLAREIDFLYSYKKTGLYASAKQVSEQKIGREGIFGVLHTVRGDVHILDLQSKGVSIGWDVGENIRKNRSAFIDRSTSDRRPSIDKYTDIVDGVADHLFGVDDECDDDEVDDRKDNRCNSIFMNFHERFLSSFYSGGSGVSFPYTRQMQFLKSLLWVMRKFYEDIHGDDYQDILYDEVNADHRDTIEHVRSYEYVAKVLEYMRDQAELISIGHENKVCGKGEMLLQISMNVREKYLRHPMISNEWIETKDYFMNEESDEIRDVGTGGVVTALRDYKHRTPPGTVMGCIKTKYFKDGNLLKSSDGSTKISCCAVLDEKKN